MEKEKKTSQRNSNKRVTENQNFNKIKKSGANTKNKTKMGNKSPFNVQISLQESEKSKKKKTSKDRKNEIQVSVYRGDKNKKAIQHAHNKNKSKKIQTNQKKKKTISHMSIGSSLSQSGSNRQDNLSSASDGVAKRFSPDFNERGTTGKPHFNDFITKTLRTIPFTPMCKREDHERSFSSSSYCSPSQLNSSFTSELTQTPPCTHLTASSLVSQLLKTLEDVYVFSRKYNRL